MNTAESTPRRRGRRSKTTVFFPKTVPGRLTVLAVILWPASHATAVIALVLLISAFIVTVWGSLRGNGRRIVRLRRTLVRTGGSLIGLVAIGETVAFLAFLASGGGKVHVNFGNTNVFASIETYMVLATLVLLMWFPHTFFTIQLDIKGTGDAQRVLLFLITATACGLTATYLVLLHFNGGPLRRIPLGPLVAAIIGITVIVAPLYRALARVCWQRGLGGVFGLRTLQQRWRNTITEFGKALERHSQLAEKAGPETMMAAPGNVHEADTPHDPSDRQP
jgi:hypothetical protein